jgi:hypothetical protein
MATHECKHCLQPITDSVSGIRNFCSRSCRDEYRRAYKTLWKSRLLKGTTQTSNPREVDSVTAGKQSISEDEIRASETLYESYGGRKWYSIAKSHCCNFQIRESEGYCITLAEPYQAFKSKCSQCDLGMGLMMKYGEGGLTMPCKGKNGGRRGK